jgi:hypothetical protein
VTNQLESSHGSGPALQRRQRRQLLVITVVAVAIYVTLRLLPTGTNLNHSDFAVSGGNSIEFCDPTNPQFIPVVAAKSPVLMTVTTDAPAAAGEPVSGVISLRTSSGKPIAPQDLLVVHTKLLHLMIADPSLTDYQHVHPQPEKTPGDWRFSFMPRFGGTYRLFADFTPVATGRSLYANADLEVSGAAAAANTAPVVSSHGDVLGTSEREGLRYQLRAASLPIRARQPADLTLEVVAANGGAVPLEPIMGAFAHLVAFDAARSGFAHLHPAQTDPLAAPSRMHPELKFKLTIPKAGRYVIWAQFNVATHEVFVPFWFDVVE